jgi:hypothetical protein
MSPMRRVRHIWPRPPNHRPSGHLADAHHRLTEHPGLAEGYRAGRGIPLGRSPQFGGLSRVARGASPSWGIPQPGLPRALLSDLELVGDIPSRVPAAWCPSTCSHAGSGRGAGQCPSAKGSGGLAAV